MKLAILAVAGFLGLTWAQRDVSCPAPFVLLGGTCYSVSTAKKNWEDARNYCIYEAPVGHISDLAVLRDCEQLGHLWSYIKYDLVRMEDYWIGAEIREGESEWKWVTGQAVEMGVPFWYPEEPDEGVEGARLVLSQYGLFADGRQDSEFSFVCQIFHI